MTAADAAGKAAVMGREWYQSMVDIGSPRFGPGGELATIEDFVRTGFIVGSAEECVREIREIADVVPVDPVVTRAHWPGMSTEQAVATSTTSAESSCRCCARSSRALAERHASTVSEMARPRLVGINHVALEVGEIDDALAFYGSIFELTLRGRSRSMAFIDIGDQFIALSSGRSQPADEHRHFGLVVDSMDATRQALEDAGVTILGAAASTSAIPGGT